MRPVIAVEGISFQKMEIYENAPYHKKEFYLDTSYQFYEDASYQKKDFYLCTFSHKMEFYDYMYET